MDSLSDTSERINYLRVTVQYVQVEKSMRRELHSVMKEMRENFRIMITKMLRSFDAFDNIDKLVFVTDRQMKGRVQTL
jgi:hypothetical protein